MGLQCVGGCTLVALARRCFRRRWPGFSVACSYVTCCANDSVTLGTCAEIDGVTVAPIGNPDCKLVLYEENCICASWHVMLTSLCQPSDFHDV